MSRAQGSSAEAKARRHLERAGLRYKESNYQCRLGEIDLIMEDGRTLVFVEVRSRSDARFGGAAASIDTRKQAKLRRTAEHYLQRLGKLPPCRFDVVAFEGDTGINWITDAF
ncbi:YraN family protein [Alkalilimnicola ehrlichii]|uniref:UPF0102 protein CAL65_08145 n=1 Tax=Alkalilimnicola ehrlichii TaxID=351052 RepID=A0A3E0WY05_9GAMM|nr:YraN family protein [Alkalilimnicola ehrlichii]RFA30313.1 YraN family protein [Alkalilimnicola ehrlichii]RFA37890.1 YraN family protein [Alkalilimnicola ehrlichii]